MESFKSPKLWLLAVLVLSVVAFIYWPRPVQQSAVTISSTSISTSTRTAVSTRTSRSVTRITKPDGTVVEKQRDTVAASKEVDSTVTVSKESVTVTPAAADKTRYRVGADWLPSTDRPPTARDTEIRVGARLGNSPAWLEGGYDFKHNQAKVGISVEF